MTVGLSYETALAGQPLDVEGTFTLTSVSTTTTSASITGNLSGTVTFGEHAVQVDDTVTLTVSPVCTDTEASVTVTVGEFTFTLDGVVITVGEFSFTVAVDRDSRLGGAICAAADLLADGAGNQAVRVILKKALAAA